MALTRLGTASFALALLLVGSGCKDGGKKRSANTQDAGVQSDAGAGSDGGAQGDAGLGQFELTLGEPKKAMVGAEGGKIVLEKEKFSLEIPKGALKEATEITATPLKHGERLFAVELKPSGLTFEQPAVGRIEVERERTKENLVAPILFDDDGKPEPVAKLELEVEGDMPTDLLKVRFDVPHFSVLTLFFHLAEGAFNEVVNIEPLAPPLPWSLPVGTVFHTPYRANLAQDTVPIEFGDFPRSTLFRADAEVVRGNASFEAFASGVVTWLPQFSTLEAREFGRAAPATLFPGFACQRDGQGTANVVPKVSLRLRVSLPHLRLSGDLGVLRAEFVEGEAAPHEVSSLTSFDVLNHEPIMCTLGGSIVGAMALTDPDVLRIMELAKPGFLGGCVDHSNDKDCRAPDFATWLISVTDPVLQLGPNAAARMENAFPCGDEGPVGLTLCASGEPFTEGEWVYVAATTVEDLVLDDPTGHYQLAFVFDADGNTANNYVPSPSFPKDFFQGTDRWYEALYTPSTGWELKVSDQRQGGSQVASDARFVLSGRQLSLFVPRSELDGDNPTFRATAFRHEGDYGLSGGPWSASYAPGLMEPLFPAASGPPFVLPE